MILVLSSDWGQGLPQEHLEHLSWPPVSTLEVFFKCCALYNSRFTLVSYLLTVRLYTLNTGLSFCECDTHKVSNKC